VNAVRYVFNKIRGKDETDDSAKQKCVLASNSGENGKKDAGFSDMGKTPISNDTSVAKQECNRPGGG